MSVLGYPRQLEGRNGGLMAAGRRPIRNLETGPDRLFRALFTVVLSKILIFSKKMEKAACAIHYRFAMVILAYLIVDRNLGHS
jgi:hypothetical protein